MCNKAGKYEPWLGKKSISRNKLGNDKDDGTSRQGFLQILYSPYAQEFGGKHKHDEDRNRRYKKRPNRASRYENTTSIMKSNNS